MNAVVKTQQNFAEIIGLSRTIEWNLEQYGSWLQIDNNADRLGFKPWLGNLIDQQNGVCLDRRERVAPRCRIELDLALAIESMLHDLFKNENDKVKMWFKVMVLYYVEFRSEEKIAEKLGISATAVIKYKLLGSVRLATKYKLRSKITE